VARHCEHKLQPLTRVESSRDITYLQGRYSKVTFRSFLNKAKEASLYIPKFSTQEPSKHNLQSPASQCL
jgi:hypothetical protein